MMMLKKAWGEVTEQTIRNCLRKSGISLEAQEGAMDNHDELFFSKFGRNNLNSYNSKTHVIQTNFESS